jgi:ketosteroid isomerase-like protein
MSGAAKPELVDAMLGEALGRGDADAATALYDAAAVLEMKEGSMKGAGIREAMGGFAGLKPKLTMNVRKVYEAGDIALVLNDWSGRGTDANGKPVDLGGKAIEVMRRQADGTWKFLIDDPFARD